MKILFVQKIVGVSGSELYFLKLLPLLKKNGVDCEFLAIYPLKDENKNTSFFNTLESNNVKVHKLYLGSLISFSLLKKINILIKSEAYDIVQSNLVHADFWCSAAKFLFRYKSILISGKHGYDEVYQGEYGLDPNHKGAFRFDLLEKFSEKFVRRSFAISKGLRNIYIEKNISNPDKIDTIYYGIDKPDFDKENRDKYRHAKKQAVIAGRLIKVKGHDLLFDAMSKIKSDLTDFKLLVIGGDGGIEESLKKQVHELGLEEHVDFLGHSQYVNEYMYHSDFAICSSLGEGFGFVIIEAFSNLKPVIAFDVAACNEIIIDSQNGYLIKPFDTLAFGEKLKSLIIDTEHTRKLGVNAKSHFDKEFSIQTMLDNSMNFYKSVCEN